MDIWIYDPFLHTIHDGYITGNGTIPKAGGRSALEPAGGLAAVLAVTPLSSAAGSSATEEGGCFAQHFW